MHTFYQNRNKSFLCAISSNLSYPAHLHKQIEIIYVLSGSIRVSIDDEMCELSPGDLAIAFPNTIHSIKTIENSRIILLIFDLYLAEILSGRILNYQPESSFLDSKYLHKDIAYGLNALLEVDQTQPDYALIKGFLTIIMSRILANLNLSEKFHDDIDLVQQTLLYIDNHFTEPLTLSTLAKQLNTSKYYLSRIFSNKLNTTYNQYLNRQRIKYAQYLLESTELSITEISFQCGFESTRTFYRAFNEICNTTPKEYRSSDSPNRIN